MGAALEALAAEGDDRAHNFSIPLSRPNRSHTRREKADSNGVRFSFSGLKSAVLRVSQAGDMTNRQAAADVAASFQRVAGAHLQQQVKKGLDLVQADPTQFGLPAGCKLEHLVVSGGAAANQYLRGILQNTCSTSGVQAVFPPLKYCSDNGVMVAWAGILKHRAGQPAVRDTALAQVDLSPRWTLGEMQQRQLPTAKRMWGDHSADIDAVLKDARYNFLSPNC
jgi:N6-L-threonylcarbamoyladenine synthase